eukprot:gene18218-24669_t
MAPSSRTEPLSYRRGEQLIISGQGVCLHKIAVVGQGLTLQSIATRARLSKDKDKEKVNGLVKLTRASGIKFTDCKIEDKSSAATYALCVEEGSSATLDNCTITGISGGTGVLAVGTGSQHHRKRLWSSRLARGQESLP